MEQTQTFPTELPPEQQMILPQILSEQEHRVEITTSDGLIIHSTDEGTWWEIRPEELSGLFENTGSSTSTLVHGQGSSDQTSVGLTGVTLPSSGSIYIDSVVIFILAVGLYYTKRMIDAKFDRGRNADD